MGIFKIVANKFELNFNKKKLFFSFQRYVGDIALVKDRQSTVNDVAKGLPILYRVRFPIQNPLPKLKAIYYNNQLICNGQNGNIKSNNL